MAAAAVSFSRNVKCKRPPLLPLYKIEFTENGQTIMEGKLGTIESKVGRKIYFPIAFEVSSNLYTFETDVKQQRDYPHLDIYMFCWFEPNINGHCSSGIPYIGRDLNEEKVVGIVMQHLIAAQRLPPNTMTKKTPLTEQLVQNVAETLIEKAFFQVLKERMKASVLSFCAYITVVHKQMFAEK